ncbi:hypothetical protein CAEBREN_18227 [Caenorhabditis brenneri]|uniref:Uncharacterized protein n=1 Tax=Caenorhabditis brenneri TaxID=135651 RepID=G0N0Z4_CAEBE|nr:hypothetical protein CAEBREN_18227 [Caenorhabditis brenneri]
MLISLAFLSALFLPAVFDTPPLISEDDFFEINIDRDHPDEAFKAFEEFKIRFHKKYKTPEEEKMRGEVFLKNHNTVGILNKKAEQNGQGTKFGINKFSDLTKKEFQSRLSNVRPSRVSEIGKIHKNPLLNLTKNSRGKRQVDYPPEDFDLRYKKVNGRWVVGKVKDQKNCACCWAFAVTAAIEAIYAANIGKIKPLSEQELCDCGTDGRLGCSGGKLEWGVSYIMGKGLASEEAYGYEESRANHSDMCVADRMMRVFPAGRISHYIFHEYEVEDKFLQFIYQYKTPIAVSFAVGEGFRNYQSGILEIEDCDVRGVAWHAGAIVGYGEERNYGKRKRFWIVKNSWGDEGWGDMNGYFKVVRGYNWCEIEYNAYAPYWTDAIH